MSTNLYLRLSIFYLWYFGALGALVPYWSLYLHSLNLPPYEIGKLIAIFSITRIFAPNLWGYFSDLTGMRMPIVRFTTGCAALSFSMILPVTDFWRLATIMMLFTFFWNAALPQMEATVINHLGLAQYGRVRLWGSVGFILIVLLVGIILDTIGINALPLILLLLYIALWLSSLLIPEAPVRGLSYASSNFCQLLIKPRVISFIIGTFLMQVSHGPYYTFYSLYLETHGRGRILISTLWALGVLCEIGIFLLIGRWLLHYQAQRVLRLTLILATLRWLMIGLGIDYLLILILGQILHAATFGAYHASAIHLVHDYFPENCQVRGQALYSSLAFGAGGAVGSLYAGYCWDWISPIGTFMVSALVSASALIFIRRN